MDIIKRNFIRLLCSGALKEYDAIEPMSLYKWDKLLKMGAAQEVMPELHAGVMNNPHVSESMPQSVVDEIVAACRIEAPSADDEPSQLYNPLARHRLRRIRNEAEHDADFSLATLQLLDIIVKSASETFSEGVSYHSVLPIAVFLRERGEQVDFVTLERWLGKLFLRRFSQFIASVLVLTLYFEQEEIPFLHALDKNAYKTAVKAIDNYGVKKSRDWNVHQSSAGFMETNRKAMLQSAATCLKFFKYAPMEVVCNFIHCIVTNISEIEE